jgi:REP element-mobilizing transposase RayT
MSESYKIHEDGLYYVTFAVVGWLDVFTRRVYQDIFTESIKFCQEKKGLNIYCFCLMPNHVHFIADSYDGSLSNILRSFKSHTAKALMSAISDNPQESRKELFLHQFHYYGKKSKHNENQFWKHDSHPFYLYSNEMIDQKINYIHNNPVEAGFVNEAHEWRLSSANPNFEIKLSMI